MNYGRGAEGARYLGVTSSYVTKRASQGGRLEDLQILIIFARHVLHEPPMA